MHLSPQVSRRQFLRAAGLTTAASVLPVWSFSRAAPTRKVAIGAISYSFRQIPGSAEEILGYMQELNLSTIELMGGPAEEFAGAPPQPQMPRNFRELSQEERSELGDLRRAHGEEMNKWRMNAPMEKYAELGAMYRDGGVEIDILKLGNPRWSDEQIDYAFNAARAVGARGISFEISNEAGERMGPFATKHNLITAMHNHLQVANEDFSWDVPLSFSENNMLNFDIGHYVAALGTSPIPVLEKYHDRISHLHLKDRKSPENGQDNVSWGQGDTPIGEVLRFLRDNNSPITAMIELEYPIPGDSSVMEEMKKCVDYCWAALGD